MLVLVLEITSRDLDDCGHVGVFSSTGRDDFLLETAERTVERLRDHGFDV